MVDGGGERVARRCVPPELRKIGNFSAHEKKLATGEVIDVDEAEAEWLLELLSVAFDFYYVTPANDAQRRMELAKKLAKS